MFRIVLIFLLMVFCVSAFSQNQPPNPCQNLPEATKDLNWQQTETLLQSCRETTSGVLQAVKNVTPETASEWSRAAKGFGEALGVAAKELGIATNEFLDSPAGYLLAAILIFNYAGGAIIGVPMTLLTIAILVWLLNKCTTEVVEYETVPAFWGLFHYRRKKVVSCVDRIGESRAMLLIIATIVALVFNWIVWANVT